MVILQDYIYFRAEKNTNGRNAHLWSRRPLSTIVSIRTWGTLKCLTEKLRVTESVRQFKRPQSLRHYLLNTKLVILAWIKLILGFLLRLKYHLPTFDTVPWKSIDRGHLMKVRE